MLLAGIDIGTTTISGVVLKAEEKGKDLKGEGTCGEKRGEGEKELKGESCREVVYVHNIPNGADLPSRFPQEKLQDANLLVDRARGLLEELLEAYPEIEAIGLTGQMHGIVYVDQEGKGVSPLYTWQDQRGNLVEADGRTLTQRIQEETGIWTATGFGLVTHLYQTLHHGVPQGAVSLCTVPDYLGMCLTGRKKPLLHASMAASLGFYDSEKRAYQREEYERAGGDASFLPEVTDAFAVLGEYKGRPVTVAIGDNQASFLGSVEEERGTVLLNVGTGGQLSVVSEEYFVGEGIEARPFRENSYLLVGSSLCGGRAIAILERFFRGVLEAEEDISEDSLEASQPSQSDSKSYPKAQSHSQYELLNRLARKGWEEERQRREEKNEGAGGKADCVRGFKAGEKAKSATESCGQIETGTSETGASKARASEAGGMLQVDTRFAGTRQDPTLKGSITGIGEDGFTPQALAYGFLRGVAGELFDYYQTIFKGTGILASHLVASGNGVRKSLVLQEILEELFQAPLTLAPYQEEAACGAALSAGKTIEMVP